MSASFIVYTGICTFPVEGASTAKEAIQKLKEEIEKAGNQRGRSGRKLKIGKSLARALSNGELNFLVADGTSKEVIAGEYQGQYQEPAGKALVECFGKLLPKNILQTALDNAP